MKIFVDIDGVICTNTRGKYHFAKPIKSNIEKINSLYDSGHTIFVWTSRGKTDKSNWEDLTRNQLETWKIKYHELSFKKPHYDVIIDDKGFNFTKLTIDELLEYSRSLL